MKTKLVALFTIACSVIQLSTIQAQAQRPSEDDMRARRAEMIERQADRLAKDLDLKGEAKTSFVATYKTYQEELMAVQGPRRNQRDDQQNKKLTDEEAQQSIDEYFSRQEQQIAQQLKRLEVERKYCAEFQKTLTVQQVAKIFRQRQFQRQGGQPGSGRQGGFGGPQGGGFGGQGGFGGPQGGF